MNERIRNHVESLFAQVPSSRRADELKDELISNLTERYNDLVLQGKDEETAYNIVIAGIGDADELIRGLREQEVFDPVQMQMQRQKSALLVSVAVALFIISPVFIIIFGVGLGAGGLINQDLGVVIGIVLMFICCAGGVMLLVYNALSKPKYVKMEDTIVEDFKEWNSRKTKNNAVRKSVNSLIWMLATVIYLSIGFFANLWSPGWMVFLLAAVVTHVIRLVSVYRED